ncbi:hypothetical protein [Labedaea rhizosphaerae]|uniref:hypothetical protein n=1 Tax=Labedaea rhizosphaerae TaxID=598644 RepID=UPI001414D4F3|nr:hypothetical protein [Labedaea rhizosphaerae]
MIRGEVITVELVRERLTDSIRQHDALAGENCEHITGERRSDRQQWSIQVD